MRQGIETVPKDGKVVILEDDASGTFELARWSAEARAWVRENGELSKITPTHWHTTRRDEHLLQEGDESLQKISDEFLLQREQFLMNFFCKENLDRAARRRRESPASFLSPRAGLRHNGRRRRMMSLLFVRFRRRTPSLSPGSRRGPRLTNRSTDRPRGAGLQSPRSPQPWSRRRSSACISAPSSPPM